MNHLEELKRTLIAEADLHRSVLRLERRLLSIRAQTFREDLRSNPLGILAGSLAAWKSSHAASQAERWIRVAADALRLIRDLRQS